MERTQLVQRLEKPIDNTDVFGNNPFVTGGGIRNLGLSKSGMDLLKGCFRFDYMGAAEFEWGAVPEGLNKIAEHAQRGELMGFVIAIPLKEVQRSFLSKTDDPPEGNGHVFIISRRKDGNEAARRIRAWAADDSNRYEKDSENPGWRLHEATRLNAALRPNPEYPSEICGWVELDNGFFFFTDKSMYDNVMDVFGVDDLIERAVRNESSR